jgi:hypothetical protein
MNNHYFNTKQNPFKDAKLRSILKQTAIQYAKQSKIPSNGDDNTVINPDGGDQGMQNVSKHLVI